MRNGMTQLVLSSFFKMTQRIERDTPCNIEKQKGIS